MKLKIFLILALMGGCVDYTAQAVDLRTIEDDCTWNQSFTKISASAGVTSSTTDITGIGLSYAIKASTPTDIGYFISFPTRTYSGGVDPSSVTTQRLTVVSGDVLNAEFKALTINPRFVIDGLTAGSTAYLWVDYCERKR